MFIIAAAMTGTPGYQHCLAGIDHGAFVKTQMLDCATKDMERADGALNARYHEVMAQLPASRAARVQTEERQWVRQRRARCLAARRNPIPSPEINRMLCLVRETDARTAYLERLP